MTDLMGLLVLLEDEFRNCSGVRVRMTSPPKFTRSPDLPQDYDPESASLHRVVGVRVMTSRKEYFFPVEWFAEIPRRSVDSQILEIHEQLQRETR